MLRSEGTGDGGLFTGILVRYLALAAVDERLSAETRAEAALLVTDTAEAFWEGRRLVAAQEPLARKGARLVFSARPELPARRSYPAGSAVELSTQLQAWMVLEAAASIAGKLPAIGKPLRRGARGRASRRQRRTPARRGRRTGPRPPTRPTPWKRATAARNPPRVIRSRNSFVIRVILLT